MRFVDGWNWDDTWSSLVSLALVSTFVLILTAITSEKKIDGYYMGANSGASACVRAHWVWNPDQQVFCSDDYNKALDFLRQANSSLVKR